MTLEIRCRLRHHQPLNTSSDFVDSFTRVTFVITGFANVRGDIAKGAFSAIWVGAVVRDNVFLAPPWGYLIYLVPVAFVIWLAIQVRDSLKYREDHQSANAWTCWQRPVVALFGFLLPTVLFVF